jgi:hypothetical protein
MIPPDYLVPTSENERFMLSLAPRAIADAEAGRPMASEHPEYGRVYLGAAMLHAVEQGHLVISGSDVLEERTLKRYGMFVLHGKGSTSEPAEFYGLEELRTLAATGMRIKDVTGQDITHWVQLIH